MWFFHYKLWRTKVSIRDEKVAVHQRQTWCSQAVVVEEPSVCRCVRGKCPASSNLCRPWTVSVHNVPAFKLPSSTATMFCFYFHSGKYCQQSKLFVFSIQQSTLISMKTAWCKTRWHQLIVLQHKISLRPHQGLHKSTICTKCNEWSR